MQKLLFLLLVLLPHVIFAQKKEKKIQLQIQNQVKDFNGEIGVYVKSLKTGKVVEINADTIDTSIPA